MNSSAQLIVNTFLMKTNNKKCLSNYNTQIDKIIISKQSYLLLNEYIYKLNGTFYSHTYQLNIF